MANDRRIEQVMQKNKGYLTIHRIASMVNRHRQIMSETAISARLRDKFHHYPRRRVEGKRYFEYRYKAKPKGEI